MHVRSLCFGSVLALAAAAGAGGMSGLSGWTAQAIERITMNASPQVAFAPAHLTVRTTIAPDADNRAIEIVIDSVDFYRSTTIELEGDQAPRTSVFEFRGVPGGRYEISARLLDQTGDPRAIARKQLNVIQSGREQ